MAHQLDLFEFNRDIAQFVDGRQEERYAAMIGEGNLRAVTNRQLIADVGRLLQGDTFTWTDSVEGHQYWSGVRTRLRIISENIREPRIGPVGEYNRVLLRGRDF